MWIDKEKTVHGKKLWETAPGVVPELVPLCRKLAAEGSVLLKNDGVLPFSTGQKIALFGRIQETYLKGGTGSGGYVRPLEPPCIWTSLRQNGVFEIDEELCRIYADWIAENPLNTGDGWVMPWSQTEMPISAEVAAAAAARCDAAVIFLNRIAGESRDNKAEPGGYLLTADEEAMLARVTEHFEKTVVVLNVSNFMDLSFMDRYPVSAVLYVFQGGQEGANALADLLSGKISPSGKLPDTQSFALEDHPSFQNFGDPEKTVYAEDIYVGYRYFESFKPQSVRYPFGFGLTYTTFDVQSTACLKDESIVVRAVVRNTGSFPAREVIQVYFKAPCGRLGTPARQLAAYGKTGTLQPGDLETLTLSFPVSQMASYDDVQLHAYLLQAGEYEIYAGTDVRRAEKVLSYALDREVVVCRLEQVMAPITPFDRMIAVEDENGRRTIRFAPVPLREIDLEARIRQRRPPEIPYTGDCGIRLLDVADGKKSLEEFVAQLDDNELCCILNGEGIDSPKVTPGTCAAFGGVTDSLLRKGIPPCCNSDGPSGLRLGSGLHSTSLPIGYLFAASFDDALTEEIFELEGVELFGYRVDTLLGPGINIHRHPLCGRNFEYFSEDPLLAGRIAAAQTRGMQKSGCTTTVKHFCCNNQEKGRDKCDSRVSERALREIYLRPFEIAVKEGGATAVMTAYSQVNGSHCASNYDLTQTVLRGEWHFDGFVMTDWWARCNRVGRPGEYSDLAAMVQAHNDVNMVCSCAESRSHNILQGLQEGFITRGDLQFCATNLLRYILKTPTFQRFVDGGCKLPEQKQADPAAMTIAAVIDSPVSGQVYTITQQPDKPCLFLFEMAGGEPSLAQYSILINTKDKPFLSLSVRKEDKIAQRLSGKLSEENAPLSFSFPKEIRIKKITILQ